jgi:glycosyltransferase involved in cell wall biosynthesis
MKILHLGLCVQPQPINGMQKAFIDNFSEYAELNCGDPNFNEKAKKLCSEFKPDIVFLQIQAEGIIEPGTIESFKNDGAFVMNWTGDVRDTVPGWFYSANANLNLFSNMRDVREMQSRNFKAEFLEIGFDPAIYNPHGESLVVPEIVFFGNNYGNQFPMSLYRMEMVKFMKATFGNQFGVFGNGWKNADGNFNHSQLEEAKAYRGAKVAINCSHYEIERYSSDRMFRILGTGVPVCLAKKYPNCEEDFADGMVVKYWENFEELERYCKMVLSGLDVSEIVKNGNDLANEKFTFDAMAKNIKKIYENGSKL